MANGPSVLHAPRLAHALPARSFLGADEDDPSREFPTCESQSYNERVTLELGTEDIDRLTTGLMGSPFVGRLAEDTWANKPGTSTDYQLVDPLENPSSHLRCECLLIDPGRDNSPVEYASAAGSHYPVGTCTHQRLSIGAESAASLLLRDDIDPVSRKTQRRIMTQTLFAARKRQSRKDRRGQKHLQTLLLVEMDWTDLFVDAVLEYVAVFARIERSQIRLTVSSTKTDPAAKLRKSRVVFGAASLLARARADVASTDRLDVVLRDRCTPIFRAIETCHPSVSRHRYFYIVRESGSHANGVPQTLSVVAVSNALCAESIMEQANKATICNQDVKHASKLLQRWEGGARTEQLRPQIHHGWPSPWEQLTNLR